MVLEAELEYHTDTTVPNIPGYLKNPGTHEHLKTSTEPSDPHLPIILATWEAETEGLRVQGLSKLQTA